MLLRKKKFLCWPLVMGISIFAVMCILSAPDQALANACQSNATTGNWSTAANWTGCGGTTPQTTDTVQIQAGHTITIDGSTRTVAGLQIDSTGTLANGGFLLTDTGIGSGVSGFTINGTLSGSGGTTLSGANVVIGGTGTVSATGTLTISNTASFASTANLTLAGTVAISGAIVVTNNGIVTTTATTGITGSVAGSTWTQAANSTLIFGGSTTSLLSTGTLNATNTGNTINYNQNGPQTCKVVQYYHLSLSSGGAKTCAITATVLGNLSVSGATAALTWTLSSAFTVTGTLTVGSGATLTTSTSALTITSTTSVTGSLVLIGATGSKTFTGLVTVNTGGSMTGASTTIVAAGGITNDGTTAITGTVTMSTGARAITANTSLSITTLVVTAAGQTISGAGTVTLTTLTVTSPGTVTNNGTVTVTGTFSGTGGWTQGTSSTLNAGGSTTNAVAVTTFNASSNVNTVNYNRAGTQTCKAVAYSTLNLSTSGAKTCVPTSVSGNVTMSSTSTTTWTMTGALTIAGDLTVGSGCTITSGAVAFQVTGTTNVTGTVTVSSNTASKTFVGLVTVNLGGTLSGASTQGIFQAGIVNSGTVSYTGTATFNTSGGVITANTAVSITTLTMTGLAQVLSGAGTITVTTLTVTNPGTVTNNGTVTVTGTFSGTGAWTQGVSATLNAGGGTTNAVNITTFNASTNANTVNYNGTAQTCKVVTYSSLSLSTSGVKTCAVLTVGGNLTTSGTATWTTSSAVVITGNLVVGAGTTVTTSANTLTVTGTSSISGTLSLTNNTGLKTFTGLVTVNTGGTLSGASTQGTFLNGITNSGGTVSITGTATFMTNDQALTGTMSIATVSVTVITLTNNDTLTISTGLSGVGGLTNAATGTINIGTGSAPTITTLTATAVGNTVTYNQPNANCKVTTYYHLNFTSSGGVTCAATSINGNLTMSGTETWTTAANLSVAGNLTVGSGTTLTTGANFTLNVTGTTSVTGTLANTNTGAKVYAGAVTINAGGSFTNATNADITFQGGLTNNSAGTLSFGTGVITFDTNNQNIGGTNSITIPKVTITAITLTNTGTLVITSSLVGSGGLTQDSSADLSLGGTSTLTTLTASAASNTVTYNNTTGAQTVKSTTYRNLTISTTGQTATLGGALIVLGNLNITAGTLDVGSGLDYAISVAGNWTNSGTFTARSGTVTVNGSAQQTLSGTLTGGSAFSGLTITNTSGTDDPGCGTSFTPGVIFAAAATATTFTITTASVRVQFLSGATYTFFTINWNGQASSTPLFFRNSSLAAGTWSLAVSGTQTAVTYLNVARSDASAGNSIVGAGAVDCNNNTNWVFGTLSVNVVDGTGASVLSPSVVMSTLSFAFSYQTTTGTLGRASQKIHLSNTTSLPSWTTTIAATTGATGFWDGALADYDYNDPTANAVDGGDADTLGGQLTINPSTATITPQSGCSATGLTLGSSAAFSQGVVDVITLVSASGSTQTNCYWDVTGFGLSQTVPAEQPAAADYDIDITITITAS